MKWPLTCGVPSTDLICPFPHRSLWLLHPLLSIHTHTIIFWAITPFPLLLPKPHGLGAGAGWTDTSPYPYPLLCVFGKKLFLGFIFVLLFFCFVLFFFSE
ncbi:profilin 1, isoform CRA_b [Rattus norvegicus]|uniref:Profilin 1, isoform CRA_b n=1 Tax=Rattus norvegicus TaxID=10116 RepID=A6HG83_RAT|nr:profilin 1, isoform CRA_b [Rattus norvegicus]EDM05037.1 profilin 1, isoform CRA_b [Rattus norvegicus]EDM05038.1 profilin 1, isoform CRA_b [Rattus norvegicus]